jgi:hypothetical protein
LLGEPCLAVNLAKVGTLNNEDIIRLNRAMMVFLGIAAAASS